MTLWKIDEEEGEGMCRGWWCEKCVSVHVCLRLLYASSSKCRLGEQTAFGARQLCEMIFFFFYMWLRLDLNVY